MITIKKQNILQNSLFNFFLIGYCLQTINLNKYKNFCTYILMHILLQFQIFLGSYERPLMSYDIKTRQVSGDYSSIIIDLIWCWCPERVWKCCCLGQKLCLAPVTTEVSNYYNIVNSYSLLHYNLYNGAMPWGSTKRWDSSNLILRILTRYNQINQSYRNYRINRFRQD